MGNCIRSIQEGELLLFGKNLPHTRQRARDYYRLNTEETPETIVIQFREDFLGKDFFLIKEFYHVRELLQRAVKWVMPADSIIYHTFTASSKNWLS